MTSVQCPTNATTMADIAPRYRRDLAPRVRTYSGGNETTMYESRRCAKLARDATQPRAGSISSVHSGCASPDDDDVVDDDDVSPLPRARAQTCPDALSRLRRKARVRALNRPPTPPPGDVSQVLASQEAQRRVKAKLRLSDVNLSRDCIVDENDELQVAA